MAISLKLKTRQASQVTYRLTIDQFLNRMYLSLNLWRKVCKVYFLVQYDPIVCFLSLLNGSLTLSVKMSVDPLQCLRFQCLIKMKLELKCAN